MNYPDVEFSCPHCEAVLKLRPEAATLQGPCPACGETILAPEAENIEVPPPSPKTVIPPKKKEHESPRSKPLPLPVSKPDNIPASPPPSDPLAELQESLAKTKAAKTTEDLIRPSSERPASQENRRRKKQRSLLGTFIPLFIVATCGGAGLAYWKHTQEQQNLKGTLPKNSLPPVPNLYRRVLNRSSQLRPPNQHRSQSKSDQHLRNGFSMTHKIYPGLAKSLRSPRKTASLF